MSTKTMYKPWAYSPEGWVEVLWAPLFETEDEAWDWINEVGESDGWEGMRMDVQEEEVDIDDREDGEGPEEGDDN